MQNLARGDRVVRGPQLAALRSTPASASSTATRSPRRRRSSPGRRSSATSSTARRWRSTSSSSPGLSKWGQTSRLTLLLPHGYEGNGPEHSSARLERFLQLAAQENIRIANCTTAAQYFHLLRRQALDPSARPLVVMTPKGLLRLKQAASTLAELSEGAFRPVLGDPSVGADRGAAARALLGEGLLRPRRPRAARARRGRRGRPDRAALSVPGRRARRRSCARTRSSRKSSGRRRSRRTWAPGGRSGTGSRSRCRAGVRLRYVGRPWRASPSEGYPTAHLKEQDRIVREALEPDLRWRRRCAVLFHQLRRDDRPVLARLADGSRAGAASGIRRQMSQAVSGETDRCLFDGRRDSRPRAGA